MSKFKDYVKRQKIDENIDDRLLIIESNKIQRSDMDHLEVSLKNPRHEKYILKSYMDHYSDDEREVEITVLDGRKRILFSFNMDFTELAQEIIDLCDDLGYKAELSTERRINTQTIQVYK